MKRISIIIAVLSIFLFVHKANATCLVGDKVKVEWKGGWYPATVIKADGERCFIHYNGYGDSWDEWVGADRMRYEVVTPAANKLWKEGDKLNVSWKGRWYPAYVLKVDGKRLFIHYEGYESSWDEWVGPERYR
ncbi:hypothetical protein K1X76_10685 [bacterium]|nr:hypothetical protein [bacterium]